MSCGYDSKTKRCNKTSKVSPHLCTLSAKKRCQVLAKKDSTKSKESKKSKKSKEKLKKKSVGMKTIMAAALIPEFGEEWVGNRCKISVNVEANGTCNFDPNGKNYKLLDGVIKSLHKTTKNHRIMFNDNVPKQLNVKIATSAWKHKGKQWGNAIVGDNFEWVGGRTWIGRKCNAYVDTDSYIQLKNNLKIFHPNPKQVRWLRCTIIDFSAQDSYILQFDDGQKFMTNIWEKFPSDERNYVRHLGLVIGTDFDWMDV